MSQYFTFSFICVCIKNERVMMVLNLPTEATEITTAFIGITPAKLNGSNKS